MKTYLKAYVNENVLLTRNELEELIMKMKERRNKRTSNNRLINATSCKCKKCKAILPEEVLNDYQYEEKGLSSVRTIICPYCREKQAIAYVVDKYWNEYEKTL